jgi:DNA-binding NarL/FixJ family response regulator
MKMIEEVVDKIHNNILTGIRTGLPALTDKDISLLTLFFAGFSAKSICLVMNWQVANFYNRKRRIREKIEASDVPHRERFLAALGK